MSTTRLLDDYASALGYGRVPTQRERDGNLAAWGCIALLAIWPMSLVLRGYVLPQLWLWFLVPLGLVAISLPHALGISGLLWFFLLPKSPTDDDDASVGAKLGKAFMTMLGVPSLSLAFGWLWHSWM